MCCCGCHGAVFLLLIAAISKLSTVCALQVQCYRCIDNEPCGTTTASCEGDYCSTVHTVTDTALRYELTCVSGTLLDYPHPGAIVSDWLTTEDDSVVFGWRYLCQNGSFCQNSARKPAQQQSRQIECVKHSPNKNGGRLYFAAGDDNSCYGNYCYKTDYENGTTLSGCGRGPMPTAPSDPHINSFCSTRIEDSQWKSQCFCTNFDNCNNNNNVHDLLSRWSSSSNLHICYYSQSGSAEPSTCVGQYCVFEGQTQTCENVSAPFDIEFGCENTLRSDSTTYRRCRCTMHYCNQDAQHAADNLEGSPPAINWYPAGAQHSAAKCGQLTQRADRKLLFSFLLVFVIQCFIVKL